MNLPVAFENRMKKMLCEEYEMFSATFSESDFYSGLRINTRKEKAVELMGKITTDFSRVPWCENGYYCDKKDFSGNHPYHIAGLCYFQEPSAMCTVEALPLEKDDFVLDMCAAPGGKATQVGAKLSKDGLLVANEIVPKRAAILAENIERCGITNAIVTNESPDALAKRFANFFDKIIVDAPCSGEGMFKKEPQAIDEWSENHTKTCAVRQKHIMDCAYEMLDNGGYIVYSTCTFAPCENEGVVDYMLKKYSDLHLEDIKLYGLADANGKWADSEIDMSAAKRIFPHKNKGEGHFVALFKKDGEKSRGKTQIIKNTIDKNRKELFDEFLKNTLNVRLDGSFKLFGDNLYLVPHGIDTDKLKVVRGGWHLGVFKKNRFEPSHALLMGLGIDAFKNSISYDSCSNELMKYLRGETINAAVSGYLAIAVDGVPIGWAKGSMGVLKNHFPKYLRKTGI